ncbi:synaptotagmin-like protein 2 isoform X2 [Nerophis ophidion]|uniref:synaptotagmin-like protein 2 isoform X2 n=1 Tax=Nerophis ophidion TaxID=159077 RepID=UPI002AE04E47|nr:synaptotagmin-like protein 2 isoform X2 [Nerophis ophidion]
MIDLSYLTEEEQGVIMTVLRRDAQLKKAEEQRVRNLESILSGDSSSSDSKLKYLTGEWFYEAKSQRHRDKIHGSEIILASMKQRRDLEGSLRAERPKAPSKQSSDLVAPSKPLRRLDTSQPEELNNAEKEDLRSAAWSPRITRHNPFNRAHRNVAKFAENAEVCSKSQESETESASSLKYRQSGGSSHTSDTSTTSGGSFAGYKPVPKIRTFVSKQNTSQSDSSGVALDSRVGSLGVVPAPRKNTWQSSSGSSNLSNLKGQKNEAMVSALPFHSNGISQQPKCDVSQVLSHSSLWTQEGDKKLSSLTIDRTFPRGGESLDKKNAEMTETNVIQRDHSNRAPGSSVLHLDTGGSVLTATEEPVWSSAQSIVGGDPPISYDINYIESSEQKMPKRSHQKHGFKLTTQTSSPTGNDENSIAKVLDWFNRSTDSSDWLSAGDRPEVSKNPPDRNNELDVLIKKDTEGVRSFLQKESIEMEISSSQRQEDEVSKDAGDGLVKKEYESQTHKKIDTIDPNTTTSMISTDIMETEKLGIFTGQVTYAKNGLDAGELKHSETNQDEKEVDTHIDSHVKPIAPQPPLRSNLKSKRPTSIQTNPQADTSAQSRDCATEEDLSGTIQSTDLKTHTNSVEPFTKTQNSLGKNLTDRHNKDQSAQSIMSPRKNDQADSPHSERQNYVQEESTTNKIKQLKSFWEQERTKPVVPDSKPKAVRGAKLNKRFTKSEYDLRAICNSSGSDEEHCQRNHLNPRLEKMSPTLGASREHFNSLLEFWDDATTDSKSVDRIKSPQKHQIFQHMSQDLQNAEPESCRLSPTKTSHDREVGSGSISVNDAKNNFSSHQVAEYSASKEPKKIVGREEKATKPPTTPPKEVRSPKRRKDSFSLSSSRGRSMRRATSMFTLIDPEPPSYSQLKIDVSPVHSHSRKQCRDQDKRHASEATDTPLARAFVPQDYSHYLGMANEPSAHSTSTEEVFEAFGGSVKTSTPVGSGGRGFKKSTKRSPHHLWAKHSSLDADPESSVSSTSESWSNSRNTSSREDDEDDKNPVRKALRRAEARPKYLAKSMEDLTASLSPRQPRRQDPTIDLRRTSDVTIPSPHSTLSSDPVSLKKISKSVSSILQKELSGSVMTMDSSDFGNVEIQGNIQFSINYVNKLKEFHIFVAQCQDLASADTKRGRSDPYVKSYLVPDKNRLGKKKTSVKKKTLNPTFNEILRYRVDMDYLRTQTLVLSVWHNDTFGRNSFLGEVDVDLSKWNFDHTQMNYLDLKNRTTTPSLTPSGGRGEMRLAVRYLPKVNVNAGVSKEGVATGEIHIWVKECKNLPLIRATLDSYVKCYVLPDTSRKSRQKTRVLRRTSDPVFNHTMVYDGIREMDLVEACVELTVWDRDRLASNLLGGLRLGAGTGQSYGSAVNWMDSTPLEVALWGRMVACPNEWVEDVLPFRMLNSAKTAFR